MEVGNRGDETIDTDDVPATRETFATIETIAAMERRLHRRFLVGVPVRLCELGAAASMMIELCDVSFRGCRLGMLSDAPPPELDQVVAFGFVLPGRRVALVKGRVVRHVEGGAGIGIAIARANVPFYEFLMTLAEGENDMTPIPQVAVAS